MSDSEKERDRITLSHNPDLFLISELVGKVDEHNQSIELRWKWLYEIKRVRIFVLKQEEGIEEQSVLGRKYHELTRADYSQNLARYTMRIDIVGKIRIAVLPVYVSQQNGDPELTMALQTDERNSLDLIINRITINYSLIENISLKDQLNPFIKEKDVMIIITSNELIPANTLEYTFSSGKGVWQIDEAITPQVEMKIFLKEPKHGKPCVVRLSNPVLTSKLYRVDKL
ncbi:MAG: hypothetical protein P4L49_05250 [Desulfosporosinus sp.]|nr:hypothetical protein [Desulfosporosinus sp.]